MAPTVEKSNIDQYVAQTLRKVRKAANLSQKQIAAVIGVSGQQVQKYESARDKIWISRLVEVAAYLGIPLQDFFDPKVWGRPMSKQDAELMLVIRRCRDDEKKAALAMVLKETFL